MTKTPELLPCPFCGNVRPAIGAILGIGQKLGEKFPVARIECTCGAHGPQVSREAATVNDASLCWNTRVPPSTVGVEDDYFRMLWDWFEDERRIGSEGMRPERLEGLSADDFKQMLDEYEAILQSPTIASETEGRKAVDANYILPCDVKLAPATTITKGCTLHTLLVALKVREGEAFQQFTKFVGEVGQNAAPPAASLIAKGEGT